MAEEQYDSTDPADLARPSDRARVPRVSPALRRAHDIVASLRAGESNPADVFEAFWELDRLPIDEVRDALATWIGPEPDRNRLDAATCVARGIPARALHLRVVSVANDADVLDLGPLAEEQLRLAGVSWDGVDRTPEDRLDGEIEGSFAGTLERRVLADADAKDGPPLFDVLLFAEDSGVVFEAGTTRIVALIAYRKVEMRDRRARLALEEAIATRRDAGALEPVVPPDVAVDAAEKVSEPVADPAVAARTIEAPAATKAKKTATKRVGAKKAASAAPAKKIAAKKIAAKKTVKKPGAKKTAKPSVARKASAKKTGATKSPVPKSPTKRAGR